MFQRKNRDVYIRICDVYVGSKVGVPNLMIF